jgi:hypothetical protein
LWKYSTGTKSSPKSIAHNSSDEENEEILGDSGEKSPMSDGGEKGRHEQEESCPIGFWDKDLKHVGWKLFKNWGITSE